MAHGSWLKSLRRRRIYLDYASAPPVLPQAVAAMREAERLVGNPGAIHAEGVAAKKSLEDSRARIALLLGVKARELVFTSGLTEANNLAILGFAKRLDLPAGRQGAQHGLKGTHWLVSAIEHDSVLECFAQAEAMGGEVSYVEPDKRGLILPAAVERMLRPETVFVSIGWANNEIGVVQPLGKIACVLRSHEKESGMQVVFHSDAGQAPLYLPTVVSSLGVDLLSLGANKLYGPHGIGALYINNRVTLAPVVLGGKQERGVRAGTESVALAAGFAAAFDVVARERTEEAKRLEALRDELAQGLAARIEGLVINGGLSHALPHMLNISFELPACAKALAGRRASSGQTAEYMTLVLDHAGISVSTKSACREGEESQSHVVAALGDEPWRAQNTLRFSLGRETGSSDVARTVDILTKLINKTNVV